MQKKIIIKKILMVVTALTVSAVIIHACSSAVYHRGDPQMKRVEVSSNYKEGKFRNYSEWEQPSFGEFLSTGWKFLFGGDQRTPESILPRKSVKNTGLLI